VSEVGGGWNSFTAVPYLTNLIVSTDRRLLAVTVWRRASGLSKGYLTLVRVHILMWARGGAVGGRNRLRVRFPIPSLKFYMTLIVQAAR
jgi:hypothetical protein